MTYPPLFVIIVLFVLILQIYQGDVNPSPNYQFPYDTDDGAIKTFLKYFKRPMDINTKKLINKHISGEKNIGLKNLEKIAKTLKTKPFELLK